MGNIEGQDGGKEQKIKWIVSLNQSQSASRQSSRRKDIILSHWSSLPDSA